MHNLRTFLSLFKSRIKRNINPLSVYRDRIILEHRIQKLDYRIQRYVYFISKKNAHLRIVNNKVNIYKDKLVELTRRFNKNSSLVFQGTNDSLKPNPFVARPISEFGLLSTRICDQFFTFSSLVESYARELKADIYISNEEATLIPALALRDAQGGQAIWYVKEHPHQSERIFAYDTWNDVNKLMWQELNSLINCVVPSFDSAICTGKGYQDFVEQLGVKAEDIGRKFFHLKDFDVESEVVDEFLASFKAREDVEKIIVYPSTIYGISDFLSVIKALSMLPKDYHLVHIGNIKDGGNASKFLKDAKGLGCDDRLHFFPSIPKEDYLQFISKCDVGIVHFSAATENTALSFHNRYADLISTGVPFAYSTNASVKMLDVVKDACREYDWRDTKAIAEAIKFIATNSDELKLKISKHDCTDGRYASGAKRTQFLHNYVKRLGGKSVVFFGRANLCTNGPTVELARAFCDCGVHVTFASSIKLEWRTENWDTSQIRLLSMNENEPAGT